MGVKVKAICSECNTAHLTALEFEQENIECPVCEHKLRNLTEGDLNELDLSLKKQRTYQIIALVGFGIALICFCIWITNQPPTAIPTEQAWIDYNKDDMMKMVVPGLVIIGSLLTLIFGIMGSLKRYIVEF